MQQPTIPLTIKNSHNLVFMQKSIARPHQEISRVDGPVDNTALIPKAECPPGVGDFGITTLEGEKRE